MAELSKQRPGPPSQNRTSFRPSTPPVDVIELIMADHRRILRLGEALHDTARWNGVCRHDLALADAWPRLAGLLETHTRAEEEICYLPMFGSRPQSAERRRAAIADHDDIRAAIGEASLCLVGSAPWWRAVRAVVAITADHLHHEERGMLADCLPRLTMRRRYELGNQWCAFVAAWRLDAVPRAHRDVPDRTDTIHRHRPGKPELCRAAYNADHAGAGGLSRAVGGSDAADAIAAACDSPPWPASATLRISSTATSTAASTIQTARRRQGACQGRGVPWRVPGRGRRAAGTAPAGRRVSGLTGGAWSRCR